MSPSIIFIIILQDGKSEYQDLVFIGRGICKIGRREKEKFSTTSSFDLTEKKSLMNIVGFLKEEDAEEMCKAIEEMREQSRDRTLR